MRFKHEWTTNESLGKHNWNLKLETAFTKYLGKSNGFFSYEPKGLGKLITWVGKLKLPLYVLFPI